MNIKNKIFLIGNGFDIAHDFKTKFSDFANYYLEEVIVPELIKCIKNKIEDYYLFDSKTLKSFVDRFNIVSIKSPMDKIWFFGVKEEKEKLIKYLSEDYTLLGPILNNSLLSRLYIGTDKNWFDIENIYFQELIPLKDHALKRPKLFDAKQVDKLNSEFLEIKIAVKNYLETIEITRNSEINKFLDIHCRDCQNGYFINFNYTSSILNYISNSDMFKVNNIHGSLKEGNIVFGYGNDQNNHYKEMKDSEIDQFLEFFKTFDYLQYSNYDEIYENAINKFDEYEVYILGHSLGMTDKTLISEILNTDKCKKIYLFKRSDLKDNPKSVRNEYRKLTYAASRIITNEKDLRNKIVNFKSSTFFPS